jgi:hypothetical protein
VTFASATFQDHGVRVLGMLGASRGGWEAGRSRQVRRGRKIRRVLEHLFFRDAVLGTVLHIAIRIVIEVPDDRIEWHGPGPPFPWN